MFSHFQLFDFCDQRKELAHRTCSPVYRTGPPDDIRAFRLVWCATGCVTAATPKMNFRTVPLVPVELGNSNVNSVTSAFRSSGNAIEMTIVATDRTSHSTAVSSCFRCCLMIFCIKFPLAVWEILTEVD